MNLMAPTLRRVIAAPARVPLSRRDEAQCALASAAIVAAQGGGVPPLATFVEAASPDEKVVKAAVDDLGAAWSGGYAAM